MPRLKFAGMGPRPHGACLNPALTVDIFLNDCVNYCDNIIIIRKIMNWKDLNGRVFKIRVVAKEKPNNTIKGSTHFTYWGNKSRFLFKNINSRWLLYFETV